MKTKVDKSNQLNNKITQMEQKEAELLERLQVTQCKQKQAYSSLENMVNVGYNYYAQCYELKKKKQKDTSKVSRDRELAANSQSAQSLYSGTRPLDAASQKTQEWLNPSQEMYLVHARRFQHKKQQSNSGETEHEQSHDNELD